MRIGLLLVLPFWVFVVTQLTGCGFNASVYPVTSASHESRWNPNEVRCVWGSCANDAKGS